MDQLEYVGAETTSHLIVNLLVVTINKHESNMKLIAKAADVRS
jgi:hypothetical protein